MAASLPPVSAKIVADAEQFIAEFRRAERAAAGSTGKVGHEVDKLAATLSKKFSFADVGKDLLKGFGVGSGFAAAEMVAGKISEYYEKAAKSAQEIEASTARQLETTLKIIGLHQNDDQKLATMEKEYARMGRELQTATAPTYKRQGRSAQGILQKKSDDELLAIEQLTEKYKSLGYAIDETKIAADRAEAARTAALAIATVEFEGDYTSRRRAARDDTNNAEVKAAEKARADGLKAELDSWEASAKEKKKALEDQIKSGNAAFLAEQKKAEDAAHEVSRNIEHSVNRAADAMSDAWVDAINGVEGAWSNLGDTILREIEGIIAKVLIVTPLIHGIGAIFGQMAGGSTGIFSTLAGAFSGYHADGGTVAPGKWGIAGEKGPEPIFGGTSGMTVIPNGAGGGGGNKTFYIDARGADRSGLARLEAMIRGIDGSIENRAIGAVMDYRRRGAAA